MLQHIAQKINLPLYKMTIAFLFVVGYNIGTVKETTRTIRKEVFIMKIYKEVNGFDEFDGYQPWSGAVDTVDTLREHDKLEEAWQYIEMVFECDDSVNETELNDFIWFEASSIYEAVGLTEDGEEPDDDEELDEDDEDEDEEGE